MGQHKKRDEYIKASVKAINEHKLFFVTDVPPMIGISVSRFYQLGLEKVEAVKDALYRNKIEVKASLRSKWFKSENPTLQIGLYKLISDDEEYHRLANTKMDITTREEKPIFTGISHKLNKSADENEKADEG